MLKKSLRRKCLAEFVEICPLLIYLLLCIPPLEDDQVLKTWRSNSLVVSGQDRTETAGRKGLYWCWLCMVMEDIDIEIDIVKIWQKDFFDFQ